MDYEYFRKINNTYASKNKQETDLFLLNRQVDASFADTIDYHEVLLNGEYFELIITRSAESKFKKKIKSRPENPINLGDMVDWNGQKWIIVSVDPDDKTYHMGDMWLCTLLLHWRNKNGDIVERWAFDENLTKYSSGIKGTSTIQTGDYQLGIQIRLDEETKYLTRDKRFVIDLEGMYPPDVYKITSRDAVTNNYGYFGRGGIMNITKTYDFFNERTDKLIDWNGKKVWICDYIDATQPSENKRVEIESLVTYIKVGGSSVPFTAKLYDEENKELEMDVTWSIDADFKDLLKIESVSNNQITITTKESSLRYKRFNLTATDKYSNFLKTIEVLIK